MSDLHTLRDMLDKAAGPNRELDDFITEAFGIAAEFFSGGDDDFDGPDNCGPGRWAGGGKLFLSPLFTSSIDAAEALRQRLLPNVAYHVATSDDGTISCWLEVGAEPLNIIEYAPTECLARLKALVAALIDQVKTDD